VEALPFPNADFDGAVCSGVIDYLPTDGKLLAEVARVLSPGGRLLLCVTNKFGYTVSLSTPIHWLKRIPGVNSLASRLRSLFVGGNQGAMEFNFLPRKHRPAEARESMERHGFRVESDQFVHFTLLPAPFCAMTSKLNLGIDEKLNGLDRTPLRIIGSCYILSARLGK
jgi:ubiquinone/menaquinone biosynthesis C-methylase UbiE